MMMLIIGQGCPLNEIQNPGLDLEHESNTSTMSDCTMSDLAGTWRLVNQSTWNEITMDGTGTVVDGDHPHGVKDITGQFSLSSDGHLTGSYTIYDEESLDYEPPMPPGTWTCSVEGLIHEDKEGMTLNYTLYYTPEGEPTETYTGNWQVSLQPEAR
jgi:hypothetical protein